MDGEDRKLQRRHRWLLGHLEPKDVLNEANMSLPEPEQRAGERTRLGPGVGCGGGGEASSLRDTLTSYNLNCLIHNALCGPIYMALLPLGERPSSITLLY